MFPIFAAPLLLSAVPAAAETPSSVLAPVVEASEAQQVAFMGVATSIASPALRRQLDLPRGVGLVIDSVDPDSPAQAAGLQPHDVLHKMDEQLLINVQQFAVLVRLRAPGEQVKLALFRSGDPAEANVTLGARPLRPLEDHLPRLPTLQDIAPDDAGRLPLHVPLPRPGTGRASDVISHADAEHTITLTLHDEAQTVTIHARDGSLLYEGRLDTPADRAQIPEALRQKVARAEASAREIRRLHPRE